MNRKTIELLAPARDLTGGSLAINCGADAVYIGAPKFSARSRVGASLQDIEKLCQHAHRFWARVYVALNTILTDAELDEAVRVVRQLYELGIDGLIIQDMGLLECNLPPLPIIASTQMHNTTPDKVAFLENIGLQRVILARELGLADIRAIRERTSIELEAFVHGALCVSYSGQCYMSQAVGGRSGNRGECAQPCRRPYSLEDADGNRIISDKYLLSIRDMDRSAHLGDLLDAGVTSFKIEGRLKDDVYIKNIVTAYRRALDVLLPERGLLRASSGQSSADFTPDPGKSFNRGYTPYFLQGRTGPIGTPDTPKMVGEYVGTVKEVSDKSFTLDSGAVLVNGDGITFFTPDNTLTGALINGSDGDRYTPSTMDGITPGLRIHRNHDQAFIKQLASARCIRKIPVQMQLTALQDGILLAVQDADGNTSQAELAFAPAAADKPDAMRATLHKQLGKLGDSDFVLQELETHNANERFIPAGKLNALRREAIEKLVAEREKKRPQLLGSIERNETPYPEKSLTYTGNVLNARARAFYQRHGVTDIGPAAESGLDMSGRKVMTTKHCIKEQIGLCPKSGSKHEYKEPFYLVDDSGHRYRLAFNCRDCEMEVFY